MTARISDFRPPARGKGKLKGVVSITKFMMSFPSVNAWIGGIRQGHSSDKTKANYIFAFYNYCRILDVDPDDLILEREKEASAQDKKTRFHAEDRLRHFFETFKGTGSMANRVGVSVKSFYAYHRYPLQEKVVPYRRSGPMDYIPTSEDILKMYMSVEQLGTSTIKRDKAILLLFAETGLRPQTIVNLRYKHIADEFESGKIPMAVNVSADITKCGIYSVSFVLEDARNALKEYLDERISKGEVIAPDSPLFASLAAKGRSCPSHTVIVLLSRLGRMAGLPMGSSGQYRFRGYSLRKRFQTVMEARRIPLNWIDLMMNHVPRGADASSYSRPSPEQLRTAYSSASQDLIILPAFVKNLGQSPTIAIDYEAMKKALSYIPQSPDALLERRKTMLAIDKDEAIDLRAKYDRIFKLLQDATVQLRFGLNEWTQDVTTVEETEDLIRKGQAEYVSLLPNQKVVIRRKRKTELDEDLVHEYFATLDQKGSGLAFSDMRPIQIQGQNVA